MNFCCERYAFSEKSPVTNSYSIFPEAMQSVALAVPIEHQSDSLHKVSQNSWPSSDDRDKYMGLRFFSPTVIVVIMEKKR